MRRLLAVLAVLALAAGCQPALVRHELVEPAMGTSFRIVLYAPDDARADRAARAAFARIAEIERIFSDYDPASEARLLVERGPGALPASPELLSVTRLALEVSARTDGAFDVTVGPLTALWRRAFRQGERPDDAELAAARAKVGRDLVAVERGRLVCKAAGLRLDYGGIAKGYALDQALAALRAHGVERALVDGGGDVACGAPPPRRAGWLVALGDQGAVLLRDAAVATSGDLARGGVIDGRALSHLVDPRTGEPVAAEPRTACVVARDAALADALASALLVLGADDGLRAVAGFQGVEARIARSGSARATPGFPALVSSDPRLAPPADPPKEPDR